MRVLRLCSVFEPPAGAETAARFDPVGGMQSHTGQLTRALDWCGVAQTVVTAWRPRASRVERTGVGTRIYRLGVPTRRLRQLWAPPALVVAARLARGADVVHVHLGEDLAVLPIGVAAARAHRRPLVVTVHCSLRHTLAVSGVRSAVLRGLGGAGEGWGLRRADAVIALTKRSRRYLVADGLDPDRAHVIPSGVDLKLFAATQADPAPAIPRPRVLFIGRLDAQKDVAILVEAVPRLCAPATTVVVGDGPQRTALERQAIRLGVADRVAFTGFVPHQEVPAWLAHADVLALPSRYEELGSVLLEAGAAGLPVVATAVGGIPDVVHDGVTGLLVPRGDPAAMAAAIDRVLGDPVLAGRMGSAACSRAAAYDWDLLAKRVLAVYQAVAQPSRARSLG